MQNALPVITGVDHVRFYVGNAFMSSDFFCQKFGFTQHAFDGFQTGNKHLCTKVVKQQNVYLAFTSALQSPPSLIKKLLINNNKNNSKHHTSSSECEESSAEELILSDFHKRLQLHGDNHVRDVAFSVHNVQEAFDRAIKNGAKTIQAPTKYSVSAASVEAGTESKEEDAYIEIAVIQPPFAGWIHTLIKRHNCSIEHDLFLPGYQLISRGQEQEEKAQSELTAGPFVEHIDHMACAIEKDSLKKVVQWYSSALGFARFISSDDDKTETGISIESSDAKDTVGLRTMTMTPDQSNPQCFKIVFVEPVNTPKTKSQIQEFLDFHGDTGIAHLALYTDNIVDSVRFARERSIPFISVPHTYYSQWRTDRKELHEQVKENWDMLEEQSILCDGTLSAEDNHFKYLLQTFTLPLQDRPTFYFELISRRGANGFGKGNIKSLFDAIEQQQKERGNFEINQ